MTLYGSVAARTVKPGYQDIRFAEWALLWHFLHVNLLILPKDLAVCLYLML
ncbi:protein of unknown function [Brevefilum fermentans]|uniref:Uncharacterized protein n=1 Tax=Candidatus Brevifilum fermentans TaxID=1986204 RepID=A0A1Y6K259_9CHLR|nr:protein of unknown function [Brevefilum fermentans]